MKVCCVLVALLAAAPAWADTRPAPSKRLRTQTAEAEAAHESNDFAGCAARYLELYEETKDPSWLFNRAACEYDGGRDAEASVTLRRVLASPGASDTLREQARELLDAIAQAAQPVAPPPSQAAPLPLPPPLPAGPTPAANDAGRSLWPTYLLGGGALLGLGVSTGFGVAALNNWDDAQQACPDAARCPDDRGHELSARARRQGNIATAGFALSAAAGVGTVLLLWLGGKSNDAADIALHVDGNSVGMSLGGTL